MQMVLQYPDFGLGSYFTCEQVNGRWRVGFIWTAHQGMQFDVSEVRKISDIIITRIHIQGRYGQQPYGAWAKVGKAADTLAQRSDVEFGADFDVDLDTNIGTSGTYNVVASYETKVRAVESGQPLSGYTYKNGRYYTFVTVSSIKLIIEYESATTACQAPTELTLDREIAEDVAALSWSGAEGGTGNAIDFYRIQCRDSADGVAWGEWVDDHTIQAERTNVMPNPERGAYRQYRVCAVGTAGVAYQSDWIESAALRTNTVPGKPGPVVPALTIVEADTVGLSWTPAEGGLSEVLYYTVERQTAGGDWTPISATVRGLECQASMLGVERGQAATFRVRAVDALGAVSAWVYSPAVYKNNVPPTPLIAWPVSGMVSLSKRPIIGITVPADPEGQDMRLQIRKGANGSWIDAGAVPASGCARRGFRLGEDLSTSNTGIYARMVDALGAAGESVSVTVRRASAGWLREIVSGSVIADTEISHQADIRQMLSIVNARRAWFGLDQDAFEKEIGLFAEWLPQMRQLHATLRTLYATAGETVPDLPASSGYPSADVINLIRELCEGL